MSNANVQVEWSTVSGGPYTKLASGTTRAYIQVYPSALQNVVKMDS